MDLVGPCSARRVLLPQIFTTTHNSNFQQDPNLIFNSHVSLQSTMVCLLACLLGSGCGTRIPQRTTSLTLVTTKAPPGSLFPLVRGEAGEAGRSGTLQPLQPPAHAVHPGHTWHLYSSTSLSESNSCLFMRRRLLGNHPSSPPTANCCWGHCNPSQAPAKSSIDPLRLKAPEVREGTRLPW